MINDWQEVKLGEVLGKSGYIRGPFGSSLRRNELQSSGIPVYEQQHAIYNDRTFRYFIGDEKYKELSRFTVRENDLIISCSGTLGRISIIQKDDPKGIISQALLLLRPNVKVILPEYLYYFFTSPEGFHSLISVSSGSVQVNLARRSDIEKITFNLPPLPEQRAIVEILGAIDDKIELNRRMNATLESIARAVFRHWFVESDEVVNWEVGAIVDDFNLTMGQSPPGETYNENGEGIPFFQGRADFGIRFPSNRVYCTAPTRFANSGDTLVCVRAPVGDLNMASEKCAIGRGVAAIRHETGSRSYTYYTMQSLEENFKKFEAEGTVFGSINKTDFQNLKVVIPPSEVVKKFEETCYPIDQKIENNEKESRILASLRDSLLPKLMRGEVRVREPDLTGLSMARDEWASSKEKGQSE
jgi:type I restriction enzyme S subunit